MTEAQLPDKKDDNYLTMLLELLDYHLNNGTFYKTFTGNIEGNYLAKFKINEQAPKAYEYLANICGIKIVNGKVHFTGMDYYCPTNDVYLVRAAHEYVNSTSDTERAAGRLLWNVLTKVKPNSNILKYVGNGNYFVNSANFEKQKVSFLNHTNIKFSDIDKIKALDWFLAYKKSDSDEIFTDFIENLADYNIGANKDNKQYLAEQTIKQVVMVLQKSRESSGGKLLKMMRPVLENAANNSFYLTDVSYVDDKGVLGDKGKVYKIDDNFKKDLYSRIKRSNMNVSAICEDFLNNKNDANQMLQKRINLVSSILRRYNIDEFYRASIAKKQKGYIETALDDKNVSITSSFVIDYAEMLTNYVAIKPMKGNEKADVLHKLITKNADYTGLSYTCGSLFSDINGEKPNVNKNLVNDVAKIYANGIEAVDYELNEFDPDFHDSMTKMFSSIVATYKYNKKEVTELCNILEQGGGNALQFKKMANEVMNSYTGGQGRAFYGVTGRRDR